MRASAQSTRCGSPAANGRRPMMTASVSGSGMMPVKKATEKKAPHPERAMIPVPPPRAVSDHPDIALSATRYRGGGCAGNSARVSTRPRWRGASRPWWTGGGYRRGHRA